MPWKECDCVLLRTEFVKLASAPGANTAQLCRRFGISRKTGYKWLSRYQHQGAAGLQDQSRRPKRFRAPTPKAIEQQVLAVRRQHPSWGGRKIRARLQQLGQQQVPAASTITKILKRHGCIHPEEAVKHKAFKRFERSQPNELWQMDFKGEFRLSNGQWCYPLTILDDHSRFSLGLRACPNQRWKIVQRHLRQVFSVYGLPQAILCDNSYPWAVPHQRGAHTKLSVWLLRLKVQVIHGRVRHPQTQGKQERFHRTLKTELLQARCLDNFDQTQAEFDAWRHVYNWQRPHQALNMKVPASRFQLSPRCLPAQLPDIEYGILDMVRKVSPAGQFSFQGQIFKTSQAFAGQPIGLRPTLQPGVYDLYFCSHKMGQINLHQNGQSRTKNLS